MFSSIYRILCHTGDKILYPRLPSFAQSLWNHEAGPKTIFFWAPAIKWCLVLAGIADLKRPAEKLSFYQNTALFMTGLIWTRYSFVIRPINYNLASVNIFVCTIGLYQVSRKLKYDISQKQLLSGLTKSQSTD
ncbi:putative mitochondrial pyruvate carrier [Dirofilaria immitis]